MRGVDRYLALPLQTACEAVNGLSSAEEARARMLASIARIGRELAGAMAFAQLFTGHKPALVVLPEYVLTGFPMGESIQGWWDKAAVDMDGPEYDALARLAADAGVHLAGNLYERDPAFAPLYFQTCFIIAPSGDVVLRYRRLISMFAPTPYDVWDRYLDRYGLDGVLPVARTEIGALAAIASEEILYPEIARALAVRGAEVLCHPTSEIASVLQTKKDVARIARAQENLACVVSANTAGITGTPVPAASTDGKSQVVDHHGHVLSKADSGPSVAGQALVDLAALRAERRTPSMNNLLVRSGVKLFPGGDDKAGWVPAGALLADDGSVRVPDRAHFAAVQPAIIQRLIDDGVLG